MNLILIIHGIDLVSVIRASQIIQETSSLWIDCSFIWFVEWRAQCVDKNSTVWIRKLDELLQCIYVTENNHASNETTSENRFL